MRRSWRALFVLLTALGAATWGSPSAQAQSSALTVIIVEPAERTTFYAGPYSLVYSIDVAGQVVTSSPEPTLVRVRLDILSGDRIVQTEVARLRADGSFSFGVTVNADSAAGEFSPDQRNCDACHYLASVMLPRGRVTLRVTALEPSGRQATAERRIVVDRSGYAAVPVRIVHADNPQEPAPQVPVSGSTRLYMWRARHYTGVTDQNGEAQIRVEALSHAPTHYVFRVEPSVVDGVLFESVAPISITVPPGATAVPPITLRVRGRAGEIAGTLNLPLAAIPVRAIDARDGASYSTRTSASGAFAFANLPIGDYRLLADDRALAAQGFSSAAQVVDLAQTPSSRTTLVVSAATRGSELSGVVRDERGAPLPFAWVTADQAGIAQGNAPDSGAYSLAGLPRPSLTVIASAPGHYSQVQAVDLAATSVADFALTRRPETQRLAWGSGAVIVPPETQAQIADDEIALDYGWLWGAGAGERRLVIRMAQTAITMSSGKFALAYLPERAAWLYVMEGDATVRAGRESTAVTVRAGEMISLAPESRKPVPLDSMVIRALGSEWGPPLQPIWEASLEARVRDSLGRMGIGAAQVSTFVTYSLVLAVIVLGPILLVSWRLKRN